jgi:hypothetical protein
MLSRKDLVENQMGINSVGLHRNLTRSRVILGRVGLKPGRINWLRWGGVGWTGGWVSVHNHRGNRNSLLIFQIA